MVKFDFSRCQHWLLLGAIVLSTVPNTPIALRLPPLCERCGLKGLVRLQQNIKGGRIVLCWQCSGCDHEWPVRRKEEEPAPEATDSPRN